MCVGPSIRQPQTSLGESICESIGVDHYLVLKFLEFLGLSDAECHRHCRKLVNVGPALLPWENRQIYGLS